ncbi:bidirectional sugar transporter N3-like [Forsythia ovata]|uniref:Bidirectional sugar transporter N3-like n=1 Tax=Forsythia ovata TaxID=205694 RepID=A0ABD1TCG2_9LAMI
MPFPLSFFLTVSACASIIMWFASKGNIFIAVNAIFVASECYRVDVIVGLFMNAKPVMEEKKLNEHVRCYKHHDANLLRTHEVAVNVEPCTQVNLQQLDSPLLVNCAA